VTTQQITLSVEYRQIPRIIGYRFGSDGSVWSCWKMGPKGGLTDRWRLMSIIEKSNGTGQIYRVINLRIDGKQIQFHVHRLVLEAFEGPCPDGMECLHRDRKSKLTEDDIPVIRCLAAEGVPYPDIAERYGITRSNVSYIVLRKTWAHVA
jgi:ligand-binding sensor domain-containing protein